MEWMESFLSRMFTAIVVSTLMIFPYAKPICANEQRLNFHYWQFETKAAYIAEGVEYFTGTCYGY